MFVAASCPTVTRLRRRVNSRRNGDNVKYLVCASVALKGLCPCVRATVWLTRRLYAGGHCEKVFLASWPLADYRIPGNWHTIPGLRYFFLLVICHRRPPCAGLRSEFRFRVFFPPKRVFPKRFFWVDRLSGFWFPLGLYAVSSSHIFSYCLIACVPETTIIFDVNSRLFPHIQKKKN